LKRTVEAKGCVWASILLVQEPVAQYRSYYRKFVQKEWWGEAENRTLLDWASLHPEFLLTEMFANPLSFNIFQRERKECGKEKTPELKALCEELFRLKMEQTVRHKDDAAVYQKVVAEHGSETAEKMCSMCTEREEDGSPLPCCESRRTRLLGDLVTSPKVHAEYVVKKREQLGCGAWLDPLRSSVLPAFTVVGLTQAMRQAILLLQIKLERSGRGAFDANHTARALRAGAFESNRVNSQLNHEQLAFEQETRAALEALSPCGIELYAEIEKQFAEAVRGEPKLRKASAELDRASQILAERLLGYGSTVVKRVDVT